MVEKIKSGIEIHQQLDTHKLFCNCPSVLRKDEPEFVVSRRLHAVAGEAGEVDVAARYEAEQKKEFIYQGYDTTCLVELDEEPPHEINQEALQIALHVAMHLNCEILPIAQIMRKTVLDGTNTSGFQRTVLIARNGWIETKYGKVRIEGINLEEDSARVIKREGNKATYRLDRLGIPLVEIGTYPDITSPEQAKEAALYIGDVLRSCKVRRGIGTIRQDVNVSIEGHPRVEIKGFQDVKMFIPTIEKEVIRQQNNIKKKKLDPEVRNALPTGETEFLRPIPGAARMYPETDLPLLKISREIINEAKRTLPRLRSEIHGELREKGLSEEMVKLLSHGDKVEEFISLCKISDDPNFVAKVLFIIPKELASRLSDEEKGKMDDLLNLDIIESIIQAVNEGKLDKGDVKHVMSEIVAGKSFEEAIKIEKADLGDIEKEIAQIVKEKPGLSIGGYMGLIMQKFKGKVSGKEATAILQKLINK